MQAVPLVDDTDPIDIRTAVWPRAVRSALPAFVVLFAAGALGRATSKPLWHDELFTLYLATRTTAGGLWEALAGGVDLQPPLYYLAVRGSAALAGSGALAARLPALLGFLAASLALYVFVRRRLSAPFAILAALIPSLGGAYMYAYEGRPYGLVLGLSGIALAAWQIRGDGASGRMAPLTCAVALAAAGAAHYYAILMVLPLAAGELTRVIVRRRVDWSMTTALAAGAIAPLVVLRPLIVAVRGFAPGFWSRPSPDDLIDFYRQLLDPLGLIVLGAAAIATIAALIAPAADVRGQAEASAAVPRPRFPRDEMVAALTLLALPAIGYALAVLVTGAFHPRYVLQGVLGLAVLVAWWAAALVKSRRDAAILVAVLFLAFGARQAAAAAGLVRGPGDPIADERAFLSRVPDNAPIVVSHALAFLPLTHYWGSDTRGRLMYLSRPPDVVRQLGVDTSSRALRRLALVVPIDVQDYDGFVGAHRHFYVYGPKSWLVPKLLSQQARVQLVRERGDAFLYDVTLIAPNPGTSRLGDGEPEGIARPPNAIGSHAAPEATDGALR